MVWSALGILLSFALVTAVHCIFSIQMPSSLETVNGSCILIPCGFTIPQSLKESLKLPVSGIWRNGSRWFTGSTDIYNSSRKLNEIQGELLGDLLQKNCTSVLYNMGSKYSGTYYFRIETGFKYTFETPVQINVVDILPQPILSHARVSVKESTEVELTCTAPVPCPQQPPNLTWTPELGSITETLQTDETGSYTLSSVLRFVSSRSHHGESIKCLLQTQQHHSVSDHPCAITVLYAPKTQIEVNVSDPLYEGSNVTIFCSADANPEVTQIRWFREWRGNVSEINRTDLTFTMTKDRVGFYYCEAENIYGKQNSSKVSLNITEHSSEDGYDTLREGNSSTVKWLLGCCGAVLMLIILLTITLCFKRSRTRSMQGSNVNKSQIYVNFDKNFSNLQRESRDSECGVYSNVSNSQSKPASEAIYENSSI
ncbi:B-cell receptor CD22-like [Hoplias malabaricus]|uniref:B-cell receptor CD22-like n=1 Tax=Hoplias malabaricus TaxID=27720 RepID=UPI00346196AB